MVLVENPGNRYSYRQLQHTAQGSPLTATDFIFPFFLYIVGISIAVSLSKARSGMQGGRLNRKIIVRGISLFLLGLLLNLYPDFNFESVRIAGVLQRIAIVFVVCSFFFLYTSKKNQIVLFWSLLVCYWVLVKFVPVPGNGEWMLPDMQNNIVRWTDTLLLGSPDPEGLLSSIPSVCTVLLGVITGHRLLDETKSSEQKLRSLIRAGLLFLVLGLVWGWFFDLPANGFFSTLIFSIEKDLWTSSYVLYTGGVALLSFALIFWFVDHRRVTWWTSPFIAVGLNSLFVYVLSHLLARTLWRVRIADGSQSIHEWIMQNIFSPTFSLSNASLMFSVLILAFWMMPLMWLYKRKIVVKI